MRTQEKNGVSTCPTCGSPVEPEVSEILDNFFLTTNSKITSRMLRRMFVMAVCSEEFDIIDMELRAELAFTYQEVCEFVEDMEPVYRRSLPVPFAK